MDKNNHYYFPDKIQTCSELFKFLLIEKVLNLPPFKGKL